MAESKLTVGWPVSVTVVALTLAVWIFFYYQHMALDAGGTAVVALIMAILVVAGRWVWTRVKRSSANVNEVKK